MASQNLLSESGLADLIPQNRTTLPVISTTLPTVPTSQTNVTSTKLRKVPSSTSRGSKTDTERKRSKPKALPPGEQASSQRQMNKTTDLSLQASKLSRRAYNQSAKSPSVSHISADGDPDAERARRESLDRSVCRDDPCKHSSCHPKPDSKLGYVCICGNAEFVNPEEMCDSKHCKYSLINLNLNDFVSVINALHMR